MNEIRTKPPFPKFTYMPKNFDWDYDSTKDPDSKIDMLKKESMRDKPLGTNKIDRFFDNINWKCVEIIE